MGTSIFLDSTENKHFAGHYIHQQLITCMSGMRQENESEVYVNMCMLLPSGISKQSVLNVLHSSCFEQMMTVALRSTLGMSSLLHLEHILSSTS